MKAKKLFAEWLIIVLLGMAAVFLLVYRTDPFLHYHAPDTDEFYYPLNNERAQNDGILRHVDYDMLILGNSLTENFRTSVADSFFGMKAAKTPYKAAGFREINLIEQNALTYNPELKMIVRPLSVFNMPALAKGKLTGDYQYLSDGNPLNDVRYWLNRDILCLRVEPMLTGRLRAGFVSGITSFDEYGATLNPCGVNEATYYGVQPKAYGEPVHLTEKGREETLLNISQNVIVLAREHPDVDFYYFIPPHSALWWLSTAEDGTIYKYTEAEKIAIEEILKAENIHLYGFNNHTEITTDINNYMDSIHYGYWLTDLMLRWMKDGEGLLTRENYEDYLEEEFEFYTTFDYASLNDQIDYEACNDLYAGALLNRQITGAEPMPLFSEECGDAICEAADADGYGYLSFYVRYGDSPENACVTVTDENGNVLSEFRTEELEITDTEWHQVTIGFQYGSSQLSIRFESTGESSGEPANGSGAETVPTMFRDATLY